MTILTKAGIGALTLGSIGIAGYAGIVSMQQGTKISDLIKEKYDYILLDTAGQTDDTNWSAIAKKYNTENATKGVGEDVLQIENWTTGNKKELIPELKKRCKELSDQASNDTESELYKKVTKHCARGVTLKEQAQKDNLTVLDTNSATDSKIWNLRKTKETNLREDFTKLEITDTTTADKIKEGCGKAKDKNKQVANYSAIYASYKKVCTKQEDDSTEN